MKSSLPVKGRNPRFPCTSTKAQIVSCSSTNTTPPAAPAASASEGDIRRALIEAALVDGMVALPGQIFYSTQIPVCPWFCGKTSTLDSANHARLFDGETERSLVA